jgi:hypothetical protein
MLAAAVYYVIRSFHWPLMLDSPIMHYVVFLIQHGLKPYSQITDMNMPGTYLTEWLAMQIFGPSDIGWRIYEFLLLGFLAAAMCVVAGRRNWIAGIYGAGVFLSMHAAEGPRQAVEREELIAVLVILAYATLFTAIRKRKPGLMSAAGLALGVAVSIKPTFLPLGIFLLAIAFWVPWKRRINALPYVLWGVVGMTSIGAVVLAFLLYYGVLDNLLFVMRTVIPVYRGGNTRVLFIASRAIPKYFLPILPFAVAAIIGNYRQGIRWNWERWAIAGGFLFGLVSYFAQGKGLVYHRYVYLVCLLLLIGMEASDSLHNGGTWRWAGIGIIAVTIGFVVPIYMWNLHTVPKNSDFTLSLEDDLQKLGGATRLQDQVQCFDLTTGCLNALYHLRIVENDAFTGDMLLFPKRKNAASDYYQTLYWQRNFDDPGNVIVLSNQYLDGPEGFGKLDYWTTFRTFLQDNYTEVIARSFPREGLTKDASPYSPLDAPAYRIYIRTHSTLLEAAKHLTQ